MAALKKFFLTIFLFSIFHYSFGQDQRNNYGESSRPVSKAIQKLRWDMSLGTSYTFIPQTGGGMSYYAAPGFSYPLNDRFSFHGGIMAGVYTIPGFTEPGTGPQKVTSGFTSVYGSMSYRLNPNIIIYGTGIKSINNFVGYSPIYSPSFDEISFGSSIRLGNNVTVGASVHFREYSPYQGGIYQSPFFK